MTRIFSEGRPREFLDRELALLNELKTFLQNLGCLDPSEKVGSLVRGLGEPFTFVVVGEYNAGKSSFVNALLGERLLAEGVIPTTERITVVHHREDDRPPASGPVKMMPASLDFLRDVNIIDTPGTNSVIREHKEITEGYIHRAELILFVISAVQPFSDSERMFLEFIRGRWDRKVVFILNKCDLVEPEQLSTIRNYIEKNTYKLLNFEPLLFPISAREALRGKLASNQAQLEMSGLPRIEDYIFRTLSSHEKILLKLRSPLKTAESLVQDVRQQLSEQIARLRAEEDKIERLFTQLRERQAEIKEMLGKYRGEIARSFSELNLRIEHFIQERFTSVELVRMKILGKSLDEEFRKAVAGNGHSPLAGLPAILEEAIDYVTRHNRKQWEFSVAFVKDTLGAAKTTTPAWDANFEERRRQILDTTKQAAERFQQIDLDGEARAIRDAAQNGLQQFLIFEGVAVAGGMGLLAIMHTLLLDFTGLAFATAIGVYGFFVLPKKRQQAIRDFAQKINTLSSGLQDTLTRQMEKAIDHVEEEIEQNINPLQGLCRQERRQAEERREQGSKLFEQTQRLENDLQKEFGGDA